MTQNNELLPQDEPKDTRPIYCNFCGKSASEVLALIAGPKVFICNECSILTLDIMLEEMVSQKTKDYVRNEINTRAQAASGDVVAEGEVCKTCAGSGQLHDAELGDIYYNVWDCKDCNGKGGTGLAGTIAFYLRRKSMGHTEADAPAIAHLVLSTLLTPAQGDLSAEIVDPCPYAILHNADDQGIGFFVKSYPEYYDIVELENRKPKRCIRVHRAIAAHQPVAGELPKPSVLAEECLMRFDFDHDFSEGLKQWYDLAHHIIDYIKANQLLNDSGE